MPARRDVYTVVNWANGVTKLGQTNLQKMDNAIKLNNDLAIENANYIDEIFDSLVTESAISFDDETYQLTINFGSITNTPRFNKTLQVSIPFIGINTTDALASSVFADGITLGTNNFRIFRGMYEITYSELKTLKSQSKLIPGAKYRITDYQCVVKASQSDTAASGTISDALQSAGHQFDIIVKALTNSKLDVNAKAYLHEGDTYFSNTIFSKWELKYDLEGDLANYTWIDNTDPNFKGVIFFMKDEFENECGYDFKNIMFKGSALYQIGYNLSGNEEMSLQSKYFYTFTKNTTEPIDLSMLGYDLTNNTLLGATNCKIKACSTNRNLFYAQSRALNYCIIFLSNYDGATASNILIGGSSYITLKNTDYRSHSLYKIFVGDVCKKIISNAKYNLTIGNQCYNIEIRGGYNIEIGNYCSNIKRVVDYVSIGNYCSNFDKRTGDLNGNFQGFKCGDYCKNIYAIARGYSDSPTEYRTVMGTNCQNIEITEGTWVNIDDNTNQISVAYPKNWSGSTASFNKSGRIKSGSYSQLVYIQTNTAITNHRYEVYCADIVNYPVYMDVYKENNIIERYEYDRTTNLWTLIETKGLIYPISITYAELLALKNNSKLVPNATYRITDYQCTVVAKQTDTPNGTVNNAIQSAGHQFDIIVKALTTSILDVNAKACLHEGDTYFANTDFRKWELKYDIDGSIVDCAWVDPTAEGFKGVIFHMKDEYNNECWYDFKNIMYSVNALYQTDAATYIQNWQLNKSWYYTFHANTGYSSVDDASMLGFVDNHPSGAGLLGAKNCHIGLRTGLNNNSNCYANNLYKTHNLNYCVLITRNDGTYKRAMHSVFLDYNCRAITIAPDEGQGGSVSNVYIGHDSYKMVIAGYAGNTGTTIGSECNQIVINSGSGERVKIGNNSSRLFGIRGRTQIGDRCYDIKIHPNYNAQSGSSPGWFRCGDDCSYIYTKPYQNYNSEGTRTVNIGNNCKYITYIDMMNLSVGDNCKYIDCNKPTNWSDPIGAQPTVYIRPNTVSPVSNDYAYLQTNTALAHKEVRSEVYCTYDNTTNTYALFMDVFEADGHIRKFKYDSTTKLWTLLNPQKYKHDCNLGFTGGTNNNSYINFFKFSYIDENPEPLTSFTNFKELLAERGGFEGFGIYHLQASQNNFGGIDQDVLIRRIYHSTSPAVYDGVEVYQFSNPTSQSRQYYDIRNWIKYDASMGTSARGMRITDTVTPVD